MELGGRLPNGIAFHDSTRQDSTPFLVLSSDVVSYLPVQKAGCVTMRADRISKHSSALSRAPSQLAPAKH